MSANQTALDHETIRGQSRGNGMISFDKKEHVKESSCVENLDGDGMASNGRPTCQNGHCGVEDGHTASNGSENLGTHLQKAVNHCEAHSSLSHQQVHTASTDERSQESSAETTIDHREKYSAVRHDPANMGHGYSTEKSDIMPIADDQKQSTDTNRARSSPLSQSARSPVFYTPPSSGRQSLQATPMEIVYPDEPEDITVEDDAQVCLYPFYTHHWKSRFINASTSCHVITSNLTQPLSYSMTPTLHSATISLHIQPQSLLQSTIMSTRMVDATIPTTKEHISYQMTKKNKNDLISSIISGK